jgi:DDE superfamily endonuclease
MGFRPVNKEELFNLRHAQARNVIERIFGVLKRRFRILVIPPEYSVKVQAQIPSALCAIHNFIKVHDPKEDELPNLGNSEYSSSIPNPGDDGVRQVNYAEDDVFDVADRRDTIAQDMWDSYQNVLEARALAGDEDDEDEFEGDNEEAFYADHNFSII